jgi:N-methylhydantoinase A/oxoprolinase/acetone carboxylase beta subunit
MRHTSASPRWQFWIDRSGTVYDEGYRVRLRFMPSNGGLTDTRRSQGKDAILSGPAVSSASTWGDVHQCVTFCRRAVA